jgi:polyisoprenoid-binding protein YceI
MATHTTERVDARDIEHTVWRIDPSRSTVEFEVPVLGGLMKVRGGFDRYDGRLDLRRRPAIELTIDAGSVNTKNARRDRHLRSNDFLGAEAHPHIRFESGSVALDGERLAVAGTLHAAVGSEPLQLDATLRQDDAELEIEATAEVDQRRLGMTLTWMGIIGAPAKLAVRGRLVRDS